MKVLFVCTGNTCRSPMAEALLKHHDQKFTVQSAGIYANDGEQANQHAITVLGEKGIVLDHASQAITEELLTWAEIVLTMTKGHKEILAMEHPGYQHKTRTIIEFTEGENHLPTDIADPFGGNIEIYQATCQELEGYIQKVRRKLAEN